MHKTIYIYIYIYIYYIYIYIYIYKTVSNPLNPKLETIPSRTKKYSRIEY